MQFQSSKQYEGIRRRRGAVVMLHPYSPLPGQLEVYPMAYGGPEDEINFLPSTPTSEVVPSGSTGGSFDPSAWVPLVGGLFQLVGGAIQDRRNSRNQSRQQEVVYTPAPKSNTGLWIGVAALVGVGAIAAGYWALKE